MTTAHAELHYTAFNSPDAFRALLERHDLEYVDTDRYRVHGETKAGWHIWCDGNDLHLLTACDPIDGAHTNTEIVDKRPGYASYVQVIGPVEAATALYRDVVTSASHLKGEFVPLTDDDGTVLLDINSASE